MKKNFIDKNKKIVILFVILFILFGIISFTIIINKNSELEDNINKNNISNLIDKIQSRIAYNHKIALEYSSSDEIYNFIKNENSEYVYKNFSEGSYTLEDLGLSYLILTDLKNNIKYSNFTRDTSFNKTDDFALKMIQKVEDTEKINKIVLYKKHAYYISKTPIYKTDYENSSNGFLYIGSKIDKETIKNLSKGFTDVKFINNPKSNIIKTKINSQEINLTHKEVDFKIKNNINTSEISFYDNNSNLLFTIEVTKEISILNNIKEFYLIMFSCILFLAIFSLIYISYKYKLEVKKQYESIDKIVENKTFQLNKELENLKKVNENLYDIAHTDFLTKTMNRRNFFMHAQKNFLDAQKNDLLLCVVMIDIDNFKKFNDQYGHNIGDKVLVLFAEKIKRHITDKTIFGRLGGEEFALVIRNTKLEDAIIKAEKLKKKIEEIELIVDNKTLKITASFGVSDNQNCSNIDEMLQKADNLLYTAKESGRNLVRSRLNFC
ncbi:sensor domain-containing diguanylate cyclase [Poseidonibacter ostreae]|jgi:two-component system, cell cycle response regulator|uniref:diguanylate cyclase n=1 Tax=Poseidonibacter ostreae TaxID=2654171 RepID=A0A6L4WNX2_9BACT|nr:diguanylate cyclase [Poseidonibacter ostreae]KAB7884355.1 diguanylate cyclase [Poseidonibacter ostreae]KAB7885342.1 diguanylate cyclase [Poseidonibacter ostreae]KAB7888354.1 diguanylate cyclase [Poseidonibacter ostreae]